VAVVPVAVVLAVVARRAGLPSTKALVCAGDDRMLVARPAGVSKSSGRGLGSLDGAPERHKHGSNCGGREERELFTSPPGSTWSAWPNTSSAPCASGSPSDVGRRARGAGGDTVLGLAGGCLPAERASNVALHVDNRPAEP
jgi:hypothetical protein